MAPQLDLFIMQLASIPPVYVHITMYVHNNVCRNALTSLKPRAGIRLYEYA